jgi:predicted nuclease of restriction endonuclease-like (RecB) superfamily
MRNIIDRLVDSAFSFQMETNFKRIKDGKFLDINKKPYNIKMIDNMIHHFESSEEYEKCQILMNFKVNILDHENNYLI